MSIATRADIIAALGSVDDTIVAEIIEMGTTEEELAEARAWISNDEPLINAGRPLAGGRVDRLLEIIADLENAQLDPHSR